MFGTHLKFSPVFVGYLQREGQGEGKTDDHRYRHQNGRESSSAWLNEEKKQMCRFKIHFSSFQNGRWHGLIVPNHRPQTQAIQWKSDVDDQKPSNQHFSWFSIRFCAQWNLMVFHSKIVFFFVFSSVYFIFGSSDLCQLKCFLLNLSVERNSDWHDDIFCEWKRVKAGQGVDKKAKQCHNHKEKQNKLSPKCPLFEYKMIW